MERRAGESASPLAPPHASRERRTLAAILVLALALRAVILFTGQSALRSDEAVVGLMAKHIVTRGETPLFLYGQPYGGGHALVAYLAAPLFALFGRSALLLTGLSAALSLVNVALVWAIARRMLGYGAAAVAALLYACSPPVVYQSCLVNGGTETFLLALLALFFFLRTYLDGRTRPLYGFLTGLFCGLAYWGMDYALLYPVVFVLLWLLSGPRRSWKLLGAFAAGGVIGCAPLLAYNATHGFEHIRHMFSPGAGASVGFLGHVLGAIGGLFTGDLAAFFGGDIDDFRPVGPGAWLHAFAALAACAILLFRFRGEVARRLCARPLAGEPLPPFPAAFLPVLFILVYLGMYSVAKFSLPELRTPRYFLPLCPFVSMALAVLVMEFKGKARTAALLAVGLIALHGAALSLQIGMRPWHEEHNVRTSGSEVRALGQALEERGVTIAFAPYEIQWRLMFETDEAVLVSCAGISPVQRYPWYEETVLRRALAGERFAFIFRNDFAFADWAAERRLGFISHDLFTRACRRAGVPPEGTRIGDEFVVYYPLDAQFLAALQAVLSARAPETR